MTSRNTLLLGFSGIILCSHLQDLTSNWLIMKVNYHHFTRVGQTSLGYGHQCRIRVEAEETWMVEKTNN